MSATDWRELCEELADSIELLLEMRPVDAKPLNITEERYARARALLAQPEPEVVAADTDAILALAAIIREVDGNHSLGAAALAEAILSHPGSRWGRPAPAAANVATEDDWQSFIEEVQRAQHVATGEGERPRFDLVKAAIHLRDMEAIAAELEGSHG